MLYGAKVLGSYVGSEESIANRLEKKLAELKKGADAITTVGSLQIQYLLRHWCFCQKIIHLQRTIFFLVSFYLITSTVATCAMSKG